MTPLPWRGLHGTFLASLVHSLSCSCRIHHKARSFFFCVLENFCGLRRFCFCSKAVLS